MTHGTVKMDLTRKTVVCRKLESHLESVHCVRIILDE